MSSRRFLTKVPASHASRGDQTCLKTSMCLSSRYTSAFSTIGILQPSLPRTECTQNEHLHISLSTPFYFGVVPHKKHFFCHPTITKVYIFPCDLMAGSTIRDNGTDPSSKGSPKNRKKNHRVFGTHLSPNGIKNTHMQPGGLFFQTDIRAAGSVRT